MYPGVHAREIPDKPAYVMVGELEPSVAIMSNGATKGCGAETFSTLKNTASIQAIYQIHRNLRADSQNNTDSSLIANLEKDCQANYIKVSVEPTGAKYSVQIPGTGHSRTFITK